KTVEEVSHVLSHGGSGKQLTSALAKEILGSRYSGRISDADLAHFRNLDKKSQEEYAKFIRSPFEAQINAMALAELEDKYGHLIQGEKSFRSTGYGRVLTGELTPEQYNYIIGRYEYLVARGDIGKAELARLETMFANLRPEDKAKLDAMTLPELMEQDRLLFFDCQGLEFDYLFGSAADKARIDYSKLRFEELMDHEVIDWRDPQYMEKLNAYVNETGLDPRTGKEASDDLKFVAKHYGWVKGSSTLVASIADAVIDYSDLFKLNILSKMNDIGEVNSEVTAFKKTAPITGVDEIPKTRADKITIESLGEHNTIDKFSSPLKSVTWEGTAWESTMDDLHHTMVTNNTPVVSNVHTVDEIAQQQAELLKVRNGDANLSTSMRKGNYGEIVQDEYYRQLGYERISKDIVTSLDSPSHKGIDGVYYNPDGHPPYIISEAKYNTAQLNKGLADGTNQMDRNWINKRLDKAIDKGHAKAIRKSWFSDDGNVQSNLFNVKDNGNIIINQLDDTAKKMK
ncbi:hypothetical protein ACVRXZ_03040, partial [Streptococcus oriscaviae]